MAPAAADDDDEYGFSDPDLDFLPIDTLQEFETNALRATQQPQEPHCHPFHDHQDNHDLYRTHRQASPATPESDYGLNDDQVVDLDDTASHPPHIKTEPHHHLLHSQPPRSQPPRSQADPDALLLRIRELEQAKLREKQAVDDLKAQLQTKAGEADTLRRRHDHDARKHERDLAEQQQWHGGELAALRSEIAKLRREKEQATLNNVFDQHEFRDAALAQRTRRAVPSRPKHGVSPPHSPIGTPRRGQKSKIQLGDGFDDDDVVVVSPSKFRERQAATTPKQAGKRKRNVSDQSPIPLPALQLSEPRSPPQEEEPEPSTDAKIDAALLHHFRRDDRRFTLLHRLLSHRSSNGTDRILEALTQHAFPSQPSRKLSSIVHDVLSTTHTDDAHNLALNICRVFLGIWRQCLDERHYAPIYLVLDAVHFILACEPAETAVELTEVAAPLIIASVDLVALPVSKAAKNGDKATAQVHVPTHPGIAAHIDVLDCLELLYLLATSCVSSTDASAITRFWQAVPSDFAIMLLNKEHTLPQITLMLQILSTSASTTSLGPIVAADSQHDSQANREDALVGRLTNIFNETPSPCIASIPVTESDVWHLRLLVLSVLTQFSIRQHGYTRLAQNRICIGRLIKYLDHCITSLYKQPLSPDQRVKIDSINANMKLIYHIHCSNPGLEIKSKLVNTLGGQHAYVVALTRLTFSDALVLEAGIEDDVVDMAHSILDESLSLEEGEAFGNVFSSGSVA